MCDHGCCNNRICDRPGLLARDGFAIGGVCAVGSALGVILAYGLLEIFNQSTESGQVVGFIQSAEPAIGFEMEGDDDD